MAFDLPTARGNRCVQRRAAICGVGWPHAHLRDEADERRHGCDVACLDAVVQGWQACGVGMLQHRNDEGPAAGADHGEGVEQVVHVVDDLLRAQLGAAQ